MLSLSYFTKQHCFVYLVWFGSNSWKCWCSSLQGQQGMVQQLTPSLQSSLLLQFQYQLSYPSILSNAPKIDFKDCWNLQILFSLFHLWVSLEGWVVSLRTFPISGMFLFFKIMKYSLLQCVYHKYESAAFDSATFGEQSANREIYSIRKISACLRCENYQGSVMFCLLSCLRSEIAKKPHRPKIGIAFFHRYQLKKIMLLML